MSVNDFAWSRRGDFRVLAAPRLSAAGVEHGFIGASADFSPVGRDAWSQRFKKEFRVDKLVLLDQVHGDKIAAYPSDALTADGICVSRVDRPSAERVAFGIVVADCMAIFLLNSHALCLVHAGWKGLAQGIHLNGLRKLHALNFESEVEAYIWPCASLARYEVGPEVVDALGRNAKVIPSAAGKSYLGLRETASAELASEGCCSLIQISQDCTIADSNFHSYRRDGRKAGRNLAFVIL